MFESLRPDQFMNMKYIIYKNKKSPTQSGDKIEKYWILESLSHRKFVEDPLTGWKGATTNNQLKLRFNDKKEAIDYATKHQLNFEIVEESIKKFKQRSYADNFKFKRIRTDI